MRSSSAACVRWRWQGRGALAPQKKYCLRFIIVRWRMRLCVSVILSTESFFTYKTERRSLTTHHQTKAKEQRREGALISPYAYASFMQTWHTPAVQRHTTVRWNDIINHDETWLYVVWMRLLYLTEKQDFSFTRFFVLQRPTHGQETDMVCILPSCLL